MSKGYPISKLEIQNFKSIKNLTLDCSKINIFIGKPNVGKSNILEALSLLSTPTGQKLGEGTIFYENIKNLFSFQNNKEPILVNSDFGFAFLSFVEQTNLYRFILCNVDKLNIDIPLFKSPGGLELLINNLRKQFNIEDIDKIAHLFYFSDINDNGMKTNHNSKYWSVIRSYRFKRLVGYNEKFSEYLLPPNGKNLLLMLDNNKEIQEMIQPLFKLYGLEFVLDRAEEKMRIQRRDKGVFVYNLPYSLTADTLQRIIFYLTAVITNNIASVIILEEPEVHSFPPYIRMLTESIIYSHHDEQFFITTHSPYLLNTIIEKIDVDYSIFVVDYKDHQTYVNKLNDKQIQEVYEYGTDIFFNIDKFTK